MSRMRKEEEDENPDTDDRKKTTWRRGISSGGMMSGMKVFADAERVDWN
jgi:hypothetical protein